MIIQECKSKGVDEVHTVESKLDIKKVKAIIDGLSRQIAILTAAKSTEPHTYNQFNHDSYLYQVNTINAMIKQSNYNP